MIEGRSANNLTRSGNSLNSKNEFSKLRDDLVTNYPISLDMINSLEETITFEMSYNHLTAQTILYEIEAAMMSEQVEKLSEKQLKEIITKCMNTCLSNQKVKKKNQGKSNQNQTSSNISMKLNYDVNMTDNTQSNQVTESKEIRFESATSFNEKGLGSTKSYNNQDISYNFFPNFDVKEYDLCPKDEETYYEEYLKHFEENKKKFLENLGIEADNPLLDIDKFVLLVAFDNYEGKALLSDIVLIDPVKNFQKFNLKIENESILRDYHFFNGQIVFIEGHAKNNEIFAQKILFGTPPLTYTLNDNYVKGFFQDSAPYLINIVNGPMLNKTNVDFSVFLQTMQEISKDNPHALIINGPILNVDNAMIQSGDIIVGNNNDSSVNYFDLFENVLIEIGKIFNDKRTIIIMAPSLSDVTSYYPLPQPAYNFSYLKNVNNLDLIKKQKLKLIANPQIFQLNEIIIGNANFEVVKELISQTIRSNPKHPIDSALESMLQQKSFYPLLPNSINSDEIDKIERVTTIDERKLEKLSMHVIPDIIISPITTMQPVVKRISSTLFINPGSLMKSANPGSYVRITSYPPDNSTGVDILNRLKVDIIKLSFK